MPIGPSQRLMMWLRQTPVRTIARALDKAESTGLPISAERLEGHLLAGGDPIRVVEAACLANERKIAAPFDLLAAIDLAGRNPTEAVQDSMVSKEHVFSTYAADLTEPITGFTKDGSKVTASCTLKYREPVDFLLVSWKPADLQERLSARISVFINTAPSSTELEMKRPEQEAGLLVLARRLLRSAEKIELEYLREQGA